MKELNRTESPFTAYYGLFKAVSRLNAKQFYALQRSLEPQHHHPSNYFYKNHLFCLGRQEPLFQQLNWTELARRRELDTVIKHGLQMYSRFSAWVFTGSICGPYFELFLERFLLYINLLSLCPAPNILKIVFVIAGRSYGTVSLRLLGRRNPYTILNLAAGNFPNNGVHSAFMESRLFDFFKKNFLCYLFIFHCTFLP